MTSYSNSSNTNLNENLLNNTSNNNRVNSESSVNSMLQSSNKQIIIDAMSMLKFQISSLDHQKFSHDKLVKSKSKFFCLLISQDSTNKTFV
jgi:hypothetical protein